MTTETASYNDAAAIRAIVFREGDVYVAQCLDYDIAAQAPDLDSLMDRLELTVVADFAACGDREPSACIAPAPNYYHKLWDERSFSLDRRNVPNPKGSSKFEFGMAKAA